ncbi:hypothetical protein [Streptomyces violarus]|nr:hypothetical protein [Streptomyces violarus]MCT9144292.1 hypothetical protein [Streptomyces violarus]
MNTYFAADYKQNERYVTPRLQAAHRAQDAAEGDSLPESGP